MKVLFVALIIVLLIIPVHSLKAQASYNLNINNDNHSSLYTNKSESKNFSKFASPNSQIYLPDTLILYTMDDSIRISASYTEDGSNINRLTQLWYNGHWVNYELRT